MDKNHSQYFAYLRTELSSQRTYLSTSRLSLAIALIAGVTKQTSICLYAILTSILAYVQYIILSHILKDIMSKDAKQLSLDDIFVLNKYNKVVFLIYTLLGMLVIYYEFYSKKK
jgi:hypothetical protein